MGNCFIPKLQISENSKLKESKSTLKKIGQNGGDKNKKLSKDDFNFIGVLGRGSFGKVYLVQMKNNLKYYAMKVLRKKMVLERNQILHTKTERNILATVRNPFVVELFFSFQTDEKLYLVLEFIRGGELFTHLRKESKFSEEKAAFYAAELILALEELHSHNIIFRDLKPENILIGSDGHLKLTDFGLSKEGINFETKTETFCGTAEYLAPEIVSKSGHNKEVDWWTLGILLYEMISGKTPFRSNNLKRLFDMILTSSLSYSNCFSDDAANLISRLLERDPRKRLGNGLNDAKEIKSHKFFSKIDWLQLLNKKVSPPFIPDLKAIDDTSNFDPLFTTEDPKRDSIENHKDQELTYNLDGFTFEGKEGMSKQISVDSNARKESNLYT